MKAGVIFDSLNVSQKLIETTIQLNKIKSLDEYWDVIIFYMDYGKIFSEPKFAMMDIVELYNFRGPAIATSLSSAEILINSIGPTKKFFYVWDLEWTQTPRLVKDLLKIYMNPEIGLIARSKDHAKIIENCWKKPIAVIEDFNYEEITRLVT